MRYPARPSFQVEIKRARGSTPRTGIENTVAENDRHRLANRLLFGEAAADADVPADAPAEPLPESKAVPSAPRVLPDLSQPDPSVSRTEEVDHPAPSRRAPRAARPPVRVTSRSDGTPDKVAGGGEGRVPVRAAERAPAGGQRPEEPEVAAEFAVTNSSGDVAGPRGTYDPGWRRADPAKQLPRGERWKRRLPRACW